MEHLFSDAGIVIRPCLPDDRDSVYAAVRESIVTVGAWMSWCHADYSLREVDEWFALCAKNWRMEGDREFGIFDAVSNEALGCVGINQFNRVHNFANLGYWVRASRTGRGIGASAARMAARFAFRELALARVEIVVRVDNAASRRTAEKVGGRFEGIARNRLLYKNMSYDACVYALLPGDLTP